MQDEMVIRIDSNMKVKVEEYNSGSISFKEISPDSLIEILKNSIEQEPVCSGLLPENCISYAVDRKGNKVVVVDFGEKKMDINYEKTTYADFPLPHLVFGFTIGVGGRIQGVRLCVTDKGKLTPKTKLYLYPFSNVDNYSYSVCLGNNAMPKIESLHQLNGLPYFILSMPNNNDRYSPKDTRLQMEYRALLEHLKDKKMEYYYSHVLKSNGRTIEDFIKYV